MSSSSTTVKAGDPIFKLDSSKQEAALLTAQRQVAETDAAFEVAKTELAGADAQNPGGRKRLPAGGR